MFSAGIGSLHESHVTKRQPALGMNMVKIGGPVYRIGVGGGAASSIEVGRVVISTVTCSYIYT